ncbi:MMS19 nucleotide excision repair protein [Pleurostoma richardsiae]|uniref:MMS19 nucleotide excision repair protein n=1 Tax=Pleurostoma richardsiae TaxID=41990 RepID=A0AA38VFB9_9PEZI|nr:MMS19 nucleotide excision repair protein [Pleurostoma richardsiae]
MTDFRALATRYVLGDDEVGISHTAAEAAQALQKLREDPHAMRRAVGEWAGSISDWIKRTGTGVEGDESLEEGDNVILRAKALGFLEQTLEALEPDDLKADQVEHLVLFFCSTFRHDIRAGVMPATKALGHLTSMRAFRPKLSDEIVSSICRIGEDFPLQTATTRFEIYRLLEVLVENPVTAGELQHRHGENAAFVSDLVRLCRQERDPKCLIKWFGILGTILDQYPMSSEPTQKTFGCFSSYFPISLKNPAGEVTVLDLKLALRRCFASTYRLAPLAFPFLLQKLDQGDAITVSVKMDVLATIKMCLDQYYNVAVSIVPFSGQIWNSLKYEVRNGEVKETIDATLAVISSIAKRLDGTTRTKFDQKDLEDFSDLVKADCLDDLENPNYTKQAGSLLMSVMESNVRAFSILKPSVDQTLIKNLQRPKSLKHTKDLVSVINRILQARKKLVEERSSWIDEDWKRSAQQSFQLEDDLFSSVYLRLWRESMTERPTTEQVDVIKEVMRGLALLVAQQSVHTDRTLRKVFDESRSQEVFSLLSYRIVNSLSIASANDSSVIRELEEEATRALKLCVAERPIGFGQLVEQAFVIVRGRDWEKPTRRALSTLHALLLRLAEIGCSKLTSLHDWPPLSNFTIYTGAVLQLLHSWLGSDAGFEVCRIALRGIRYAMEKSWTACAEHGVQNTSEPELLATNRSELGADLQVMVKTYPRIDEDYVGDFEPSKVWQQMNPANDKAAVFGDLQRLCFVIVRQLYRRATRVFEPSGVSSISSEKKVLGLSGDFSSQTTMVDVEDHYLQGVSAMATFVIRGLSVQAQRNLQLDKEALLLFRLEAHSEPSWSPLCGGRTNVLSVGILQGLWPTVLTDMCTIGAFSINVVAGITPGEQPLQSLAEEARDRIAFIMANKYRGGRGTADQDYVAWSGVLRYLANRLEDAALTTMPFDEFNRLMWIIAGAIWRRDRHIEDLVSAIRSIPSRGGEASQDMARSMEVLVAPKTWYSEEDHAVAKPTFRHWAYLVLVRPVLNEAYPFREASSRSIANTTYVLAMVQHMSFDMYEDDAESITRLIVAGIGKLASYHDLEAAFTIFLRILDKDNSVFEGHLKAVIDSTYDVYSRAVRDSLVGQHNNDLHRRFWRSGSASTCRKLALQVIGSLPGRFEARHLLPFYSNTMRGLGSAAGDPVRDVRAAALQARKAWSRVA